MMVGYEKIEEMSSAFRVLSICELVQQCRARGLGRLQQRKRPRLERSLYIGYFSECIRCACVLGIFLMLLMIRYGWFSLMLEGQKNFSQEVLNSIYFGLMVWLFLCVAVLVTSFFMISTYYGQRPYSVASSFSINLVFSVAFLAFLAHVAIYESNAETYVKELLVTTLLPYGINGDNFQNFQSQFSCCGLDSPQDYSDPGFFVYNNTIENKAVRTKNNMDWMFIGHNSTFIRFLPRGCCPKINSHCSAIRVSAVAVEEIKRMIAADDYGAVLPYLEIPKEGSFHRKGCVPWAIQKNETILVLIKLFACIFAFFTVVTTAFIIILILYHGSLGRVISYNTVHDSTRCTGVWFFMYLDQPSSEEDYDLDDFSLIEMLKKSNIDNIIRDPEEPKITLNKSR
ncbi:unnamed protein product [Caenorhabditis auriculariae]|uniref:Tetraspanin n=1 Tax=Caenorhabditis auriculariae TaxID=2777116 RepID=A0A8S1HNU3_9PELO|nr:unnamed protein product [Caenorhabditis auriculariae]